MNAIIYLYTLALSTLSVHPYSTRASASTVHIQKVWPLCKTGAIRVPSNRNGCCMWYSENCRQPFMQFACMPWLFRPIGAHQCSALSYIWMCKLHAYTHKYACTNTHTHVCTQCMHMLVPCHRHIPAHLCKAHCHNLRKAHLYTCPKRKSPPPP